MDTTKKEPHFMEDSISEKGNQNKIPLPETNFDEIYAVLLTTQTIALENYRIHIQAAHEARENRRTMVDFSPAKGQITIDEQSHLIKAIKARESMELIASAIKNVTFSEEKFTFGASQASLGNEETAMREFTQSSSSMNVASNALEEFASIPSNQKMIAKAFLENENNKYSNAVNVSSDDSEAYVSGYAIGKQLNVFASSMKQFARSIADVPNVISKAVREKSISVAESVSQSVRGFFSKASRIFSNAADSAINNVINANDARGRVHEKMEDVALGALGRCCDYIEALDGRLNRAGSAFSDKATIAIDTIYKHGAGVGSIATGIAELSGVTIKPAMGDVISKLNNFRAAVASRASIASAAVGSMYAEGVKKAEDAQQARKKTSP